MNTLKHLAIIMDGNGRWAKQKGKMRTQGHKKGIQTVREITQWCAKNDISYLTLYAFSTENWNRPKTEVDFLMKSLKKYLLEEANTYHQNNIRFKAIGNIDAFNDPLKALIKDLEKTTSSNTALTQILALNYGSRDEIKRTFEKILSKKSYKEESNIEELIQSNLDTAGIPDVDLLIRTGGEMRLSNFLLWQSSYAELFFSTTLWPDFTPTELHKIIQSYQERTRRFGGL
ncbi:di-trans,poly-cis-decaprenylcistransferase [Helicobacter cappadocius]|uniref:Isoprenyl transferase n=1 Tax=Helicobacter cappadocius TaxID=3063998 RepID=A0AA90PQL5_9HELI|nr:MULTISPECIES: di-trans,poly-cis-decaprenylcistransferase [unclassified Helicobacter]MDO7252989.1 di-trans,poly-cis-decaprenylcistransferase [Helicobacter sp. faydin-H75]MDP2539021.1 di-trans,poly-cis-decaprenylcistransferase [Helicobacter sp. faydin-H76]